MAIATLRFIDATNETESYRMEVEFSDGTFIETSMAHVVAASLAESVLEQNKDNVTQVTPLAPAEAPEKSRILVPQPKRIQ